MKETGVPTVNDINGKKEINPQNLDLKFLKLLGKQFPTISAASTEIINLKAILNLPKGTEHFISDVHGEYESFKHVLKNASGVIKRKINDIFGDKLTEKQKKNLATLIYYPEEKINIIKEEMKKNNGDMHKWYEDILYRLVEVTRNVASKYTHSKVRKSLPKDFAYIIEELLHERKSGKNKHEYYLEIIKTIINIDRAKDFIIAMSRLIQRLVVDRIHIVGDIYDRGPGADIIIDALMKYHSVDIQWGNHDILWMGAASGSMACIANVLRISLRYGDMDTLEDGYGINMRPLATFALEFYKDENNDVFTPKNSDDETVSAGDIDLMRKMHKAISVIQFKLEGRLIKRNPNFLMDDRLMLDKIDYKKSTITLNGNSYALNDSYFPTINPETPYELTAEEQKVMKKMSTSFLYSQKMKDHMRFLYAKGSLYLAYNSNLLFHGCVPLDADGSLSEVEVKGEIYKGKSLFDRLERLARKAYFTKYNDNAKQYPLDVMWYLWCGPRSPLFGKDKMATFERYLINDKVTHKEVNDPFFKLRDDENMCRLILRDFGLDVEKSHLICGHVPVKEKKGESPIKAGGKLLVIDGGFSKAYQPQTGIAGYTLIYNSRGLQLVSHESFESTEKAIREEKDIFSSQRVVERTGRRIRIKNTDIGVDLKHQVDDLKDLLYAYKKGLLKEQPYRFNRRKL
ncbi:MAG: fructose-1,6-bisphosphatase [bacterium]|nr:fructose-1,6-bisphosphatase [bacterium]